MEYHSKIIQLILPNKKLIKINISGDENELKELLSEISGLSPSQIKGLKDSNGNYYTLSSALKTEDICNGSKNCYFELIFGKENSNKISPSKNNETNNIIFTNSPNVGNYIANYYINGFKKLNCTQNLNKYVSEAIEQNEINMINKYLRQLMSNHKITKEQYSELITLVHKKNKELLNEFKYIFSGKSKEPNFVDSITNYIKSKKQITFKSSTPILKPKLDKNLIIKNNQNINLNNKVEIYEKMKEYFDEEDLDIIRISLKYENESVIEAIRKYKNNHIISNLILIFKKFIAQYKKRSLLFGDKIKYLLSTRKLDFDKENEGVIHLNKSFFKSTIKLNAHKNLVKTISNIRSLSHSSSGLNKINDSEKKITKKNIKKLLKPQNQIIFDYLDKNVKEEYNLLEKLYKENNMNNINVILNEKCEKFIDNELKKYSKSKGKYLTDKELKNFHNLTNDNNSEIQYLYNQFQIQQNLSNFIKEIYKVIKKDEDTSIEEISQYNELIIEFLNDLPKIEIDEKEQLKIKYLIESKNLKILNILKQYKNKKDITLYKKEIKSLNQIKHTGKILEKFEQRASSPKHNHNNNNRTFDFEEIINDIKEKILLTFNQIKIIEDNYSIDDNLKTIVDDYYIYKSLSFPNFKIKLNEYLKNKSENNKLKIRKSKSKQKTVKIQNIKNDKNQKNKNLDFSTTPEIIKKSKKELSFFLHNEEKIENKILIKQKEIISLLHKEDCFDDETFKIINKKIEQDDRALFSAFEVYAVSQDHIEFIETLKLIADLFSSHKESFYVLLNHSSFNSSQKEQLENLFSIKNSLLIQALEKYENNFDKVSIYKIFNELISNNN